MSIAVVIVVIGSIIITSTVAVVGETYAGWDEVLAGYTSD